MNRDYKCLIVSAYASAILGIGAIAHEHNKDNVIDTKLPKLEAILNAEDSLFKKSYDKNRKYDPKRNDSRIYR